jgi:hypothetical protein
MPIELKFKDTQNLFNNYKSVLIVPCNVCPKMCLSAEKKKPLINLFGSSKDDCFSEYLNQIRKLLEDKKIYTGLFRIPPTSPMMCLWPMSVRNRLRSESNKYDAIGVIGCESAVATVAGAVDKSAEDIIMITESLGIANFITEIHYPFRIDLIASSKN